jgi:menaquinone-dependent protoporphyrinogen oxidase
MKKVAIVVPSPYGQTAKIAHFMQDRLALTVDRVELLHPTGDENRPPANIDGFDAVIIGGPIFNGKYMPELVEWTRQNLDKLNAIPCGFFSVSLNAADKRPQARQDDDRLLREFLAQTNLKPGFVASLAGALQYTRYGFFKRLMMKRISAAAGGPTDTSKDHEMTDWSEVAAFVDAFAANDDASRFATSKRLPDAVGAQPTVSMMATASKA